MSHFNADTGPRGGSPNPGAGASPQQRGGHGSDGQASAGFKNALLKTKRTSGRLKDQLPNKVSFSGKGFRKPNYFAQGGRRHGLHIGAGAPFTAPAQDGADAGGE